MFYVAVACGLHADQLGGIRYPTKNTLSSWRFKPAAASGWGD